MKYATDYSRNAGGASILPTLKFDDVVWWEVRPGMWRTGVIRSIELIDGVWWASAKYEQCPESLPGVFILENRHASGFTPGTDPTFPVRFGQKVWFYRAGLWQAAYIKDLYIVCDRWFADLGFERFYGLDFASVPVTAIRTTAPDLTEDQEYGVWLDSLISA